MTETTDCNYLHTVVKVIQSIGTWPSVSEVKLGLWPHLKWRSDHLWKFTKRWQCE